MKNITIGVMGTASAESAEESLRIFFSQAKPFLISELQATSVTVLSGPADDVVAHSAYAIATEMDWLSEVQTDWGQKGSQFYMRCDIIIKLGDSANPWFEEQEAAYRSYAGENVSFWIILGG